MGRWNRKSFCLIGSSSSVSKQNIKALRKRWSAFLEQDFQSHQMATYLRESSFQAPLWLTCKVKVFCHSRLSMIITSWHLCRGVTLEDLCLFSKPWERLKVNSFEEPFLKTIQGFTDLYIFSCQKAPQKTKSTVRLSSESVAFAHHV